MAIGIALTIGLNSVDPEHYEGWIGTLNACEADADDMSDLAVANGFTCTKLLTSAATRAAVMSAIAGAARQLKSGDMFLISYSGHGGQTPDLNGDEPDGLDETWCLYDAQLIDDELYSLWGAFAPGVRIVMLSDSCHSGSVSREPHYIAQRESVTPLVYRAMPRDVAQRVYLKNQAFYDPILASRDIGASLSKVSASILLISGCQDNQLSQDGTFNGLFTGTMKSVWNGGTYRDSYRTFHKNIGALMPPDQSPRLSMVGAMDLVFAAQRPFTI
ncbi:MAG: caspase family protein [Telluria sp.]